MIPLVFDVETTGLSVRTQRKLPTYVKMALKAMLLHWFTRFFKFHFSRQAFYRYPGAYRRRRTKKPRDPRPLVESGELRSELEGSFRVSGTAKLMKATMTGPGHLAYRRPGHPDLMRELTVINRKEQRLLSRVFAETFTKLINGDKEKERVRIR